MVRVTTIVLCSVAVLLPPSFSQLAQSMLFGNQFHHVPIRVVQVHLAVPVGPLLQRRGNTHAILFNNFERPRHIVHAKREMMPARNYFAALVRPACSSGFCTFLGRVNLHTSRLKPKPGEAKRRPRNFAHPQHVDIEPSRRFQIGANDRDMIKGCNMNSGSSRHVRIMAQPRSSGNRPHPAWMATWPPRRPSKGYPQSFLARRAAIRALTGRRCIQFSEKVAESRSSDYPMGITRVEQAND